MVASRCARVGNAQVACAGALSLDSSRVTAACVAGAEAWGELGFHAAATSKAAWFPSTRRRDQVLRAARGERKLLLRVGVRGRPPVLIMLPRTAAQSLLCSQAKAAVLLLRRLQKKARDLRSELTFGSVLPAVV